jgi:hypothetical protein
MNRKLIYISFGRLTDKISRDWYIDYSIDKGAIVEYWDIVSLMREEHDEYGALNPDYLHNVKSYRELEELLQRTENQGAVYVMLLSYSGRLSKPYRLLSKYNCKMVFLNWGAMPITAPAPRWQRMIYRFFSQPVKFVRAVSDTLLGIGYRKLNIVKRFDVVFAAGRTLTSVDQYAKKVVPFNLCDFDHYSRLKLSDERTVKEKYAVFLDINLPYQSDLAICGLPAVTAASYFQSLNRFFALLEKTHGIKVVIASHPKAAYVSDEFEQRESYRMLTAELVKDAEYVITHTSTALSYAILNLKPILFIYTDEMERIYKNTVIREIECLALYLNVYVYNVDKITDGNQITIQPPSRERYDSYKYNYLTSPESESMSSADIFWREINAISRYPTCFY